jgi:hypothetical protein
MFRNTLFEDHWPRPYEGKGALVRSKNEEKRDFFEVSKNDVTVVGVEGVKGFVTTVLSPQ